MNWKKLASTGLCAGAFVAVAAGGWFVAISGRRQAEGPVAQVPRPVKAIQAGSNVPTRSREFRAWRASRRRPDWRFASPARCAR